MTDDTTEEAIARELMTQIGLMFPECAVVVDCDYAENVEYGLPIQNKDKAQLRQEIARWAEGKKISVNPRFIDYVVSKVTGPGQMPQPFFRPAIYEMKNNEALLKDLVSGNITTKQLAEMLAERMKEILRENDTVFSHELENSIKVVDAEQAQYTSASDPRITQEMRESTGVPDLNYNGKRGKGKWV